MIYMVLSTVSLLYPMAWYFYIWIYWNMMFGEQSAIVNNEQFAAQYLFIWIIGGLYSFTLLMGMILVSVHICIEGMNRTIAKLKAVVFEWSVHAQDDAFCAHRLTAAKSVQQKLLIVRIVSQSLNSDAASIVLNYLYFTG